MEKIEILYNSFIQSAGVSIDSRSILQNQIFFAIKGERFDGHNYLDKAFDKGCRVAVISDDAFQRPNTFLVKDTIEALQNLATYHRRKFNIPVFGITGSNGKTTTKELLARVMSTTFKTHSTSGNLNNHLGVPLTLLSMPLETEFAIIEMGANHVGEIALLANIAEPTIGLVTNIGFAHIGEFGSFDNIRRTKLSLLKYVQEHNGKLLINMEDPNIAEFAKDLEDVITYNRKRISIDRIQWKLEFDSASFMSKVFMQGPKNKNVFTSNLYGDYNHINMAAAISCGLLFEIDQNLIGEAINSYIPTNNRSQILEISTNKIILDSYNANPDSMLVAIQEFKKLPGKKVMILGDMLELGDFSEEKHAEILAAIDPKEFKEIYLVGKLFPKIHFGKYYKDWQSMSKDFILSDYQKTNFLIKGSRSIALENLIKSYL